MNAPRKSGQAEQIGRLEAELRSVQESLVASEAGVAERLAEVSAIEKQIEARLGKLTDQLDALETEIAAFQAAIKKHRDEKIFGEYLATEKIDARRTWSNLPPGDPLPVSHPPTSDPDTQLKALYRQLARLYHPDLASDNADLLNRHEMMAAINHAYATRNLAELKALSIGVKTPKEILRTPEPVPSGRSRLETLQAELDHYNRRLRQVQEQISGLKHHPSLVLSLDLKLARHDGRDLLGEMAQDLRQDIARKTVERDYLKAQLDHI